MRRGTVTWWSVAGLLAAGLALRLVLLHFRPPVSGDALVYGDIATNLLRHKMYAITDAGVVRPTLIRLPGYPSFLAVCFSLFGYGNYLAPVLLQIILDLVSCCLLGLLAARLAGARVGLWTLGMAALCPFTANYSAVPLTETLSIFCTSLGFFSLERWQAEQEQGSVWNKWLAIISATASFAVLLRPDRALLFAAITPAVAWIACTRTSGISLNKLTAPILLVICFCLPLTIWAVRNWKVFHVVQPISPKYANDPGDDVAVGFMRWYRTWGITYENTVDVYWPYDGSLVHFADIPPRAFEDESQRAATEELITRYNEESGSTPAVDNAFAALAQGRITAHPIRYYLLLPVARLVDMWFQPRTELLKMPLDWWGWRVHPAGTLFSAAYVLINLLYLVLAAVGWRKWRAVAYDGHRVLAYALLGFVMMRSLLLATLDNAEQRYTIDCFPVVLLLAGLAFALNPISAESDSPSYRWRTASYRSIQRSA